MAEASLPEQFASTAETIVNTLTQTDYQHDQHIVAAEGIYDCDCGQFVAAVLSVNAPNHYDDLTIESGQPAPRAFEWFEWFATLAPASTNGWHRIDLMADAARGDIIAWRFPTVAVGSDTGHVLIVADTPKTNGDGVFIVRVYDAAVAPHFEDTRAAGTGGVGSGFVNFKADAEGRPISFQFSPTGVFTTFPILIARLDPLASGN
jgi:hypothetical protein